MKTLGWKFRWLTAPKRVASLPLPSDARKASLPSAPYRSTKSLPSLSLSLMSQPRESSVTMDSMNQIKAFVARSLSLSLSLSSYLDFLGHKRRWEWSFPALNSLSQTLPSVSSSVLFVSCPKTLTLSLSIARNLLSSMSESQFWTAISGTMLSPFLFGFGSSVRIFFFLRWCLKCKEYNK